MLFTEMAPKSLPPVHLASLSKAQKHLAAITHSGRFPHRNGILGRLLPCSGHCLWWREAALRRAAGCLHPDVRDRAGPHPPGHNCGAAFRA